MKHSSEQINYFKYGFSLIRHHQFLKYEYVKRNNSAEPYLNHRFNAKLEAPQKTIFIPTS